MLAPLLVQARQSAQLGSLEQRFLLQTRSLAFVDLISDSHSQKGPVFCSRALSHTRGTGTTVPWYRGTGTVVPRYERLYRSTAALCLIYTYTYFISHRRLRQSWHIYSIIGHLHTPEVPAGTVPYASFIITGSCPTTEIQFSRDMLNNHPFTKHLCYSFFRGGQETAFEPTRLGATDPGES